MLQPLLTTLERASLNCAGYATGDGCNITNLIAAVSGAVERYLKRNIAARSYDEVSSVRCGLQTLLEVSNMLTGTNSHAWLRANRTGLELVRVASGALSRDPSVRNTASAPSGGTSTFTSYLDPASSPEAVRQLLDPWRARRV